MIKSTFVKVAGFTLAAGVTATLVGLGATGTGAYFTDKKPGTINASTGGVHVNTSSLTLNFAGLLPGEFQTNTVNYQATGSGAEDIWLVLPTDGTADAFTGTPGTPSGNAALGRYGHFAISSPEGTFTSFNLATAGTGIHSGTSCTVDANGHGGSAAQATDTSDVSVPFCPVPNAILLSSNLTTGQSASADLTFGFTKLLKSSSQEDSPLGLVANFSVVATQHGILPNDPNNG